MSWLTKPSFSGAPVDGRFAALESAVVTADTSFPDEQRLAIAYTPPVHRPALAVLFAFDAMLDRFVHRESEPLLIQMRLAWWREQLSGAGDGTGDPVLVGLRAHYAGEEDKLIALIDGWEGMLGERPFAIEAVSRLADARVSVVGSFARGTPAKYECSPAERAALFWALADIAARASDDREEDTVHALVPKYGEPLPRSRELRGIAVLGGLGRFALRRREPLLHGKRAALEAFRLGVLAR
jgi:phytoene synthase